MNKIRPREQKTEQLRVASYNIRKCIGLDRRRDPARVLEVINHLEADVVALQEADRRFGPRPAALPHVLVEGHSDLVPLSFDTTGVSLGWHGNAILVRKELRVTVAQPLSLPGLEPRGAVLAELSFRETSLRLVGVHLGLMRRHRRLQLAHIAEELAARPAMPTIILGDFNEWSPSGGLEALERQFRIYAPGRSFHAARPIAALDRIGLSDRLELRDAGVVDQHHARRASDHLPVWADVSLTPDEESGH